MEKMPYQPGHGSPHVDGHVTTATSDWCNALPVLIGNKVTLRELAIVGRAVALRDVDGRRSVAFHLAAADHG